MRFLRLAAAVLAASVPAAAAPAPAPGPGIAQARAAVARLPLRFEANLGQWNPAVRYVGHADNYSVILTRGGASLSFGGSQRVDIALEGSNAAAGIVPEGRAPLTTNYFVGARKNWRSDAPNYSRIVYRGAYPGIDAAYYGEGGRLEYDFEIAPNADPSVIRMKFQGAGRLTVTPGGDLVIGAYGREITQKRPVAFQRNSRGERTPVEAEYIALGDGTLGFRLGGYDRRLPLTIDPLLVYSSYWGGLGSDDIKAVKVDAAGRLYAVGSIANSDLTASDDAYLAANAADTDINLVNGGTNDLFVMVLNARPSGAFALVYLSYLGGTGADTATAVDLDSSGNLYIVGDTRSTDFPMVGSSVQSAPSSTTAKNVFVAEFNPAIPGTAALLYSTYLGGTLYGTTAADNTSHGIAVDKDGMIYVIGSTTADDFPVTANAFQAVRWGPRDAFLCKIDPANSSLAYSTYLGGEEPDEGWAIAVAPSGLVYFGISTASTQFPLAAGSYSIAMFGAKDIVVGVMDMTLSGDDSLVYDTYLGGSQLDEVRKITFDQSGRMLITGFTFSPDFPVTGLAVQTQLTGESDAFLTIIDPSKPEHLIVYSTYLGGSAGDVGYDVVADAAGVAYVTGYTYSKNFPTTVDALQRDYRDGAEAFVAKIDPKLPTWSGLLYSTYIGDAGIHVPTSLALGSDGSVYVGGYTTVGMPAVGDAARLFGGGHTDGFVFALSNLAGTPIRSTRQSIPHAPRF